jgi:excinuclease UvrABC nuclease subunit
MRGCARYPLPRQDILALCEPKIYRADLRARQLQLLPSAKPLTERFGSEFFRTLPKLPGVYLMFDRQGRCIYVGQSQNLRQRVTSYRHVHPERNSRKIIRLVHTVDRIEWEICLDSMAAKLRENSLLRQHRPRFNTLNTYPKIHCFLGLRIGAGRLDFRYTRQELTDDFTYFGAFKSGCLMGFAALLRLLWLAVSQKPALDEYPRQLLAASPPKNFTIEINSTQEEAISRLLVDFFAGYSDGIQTWLKQCFPALTEMSKFQQALVTSDFEQLNQFFSLGPERNAILKARHRLQEQLIAQEQLDDLLVDWKSDRRTGHVEG